MRKQFICEATHDNQTDHSMIWLDLERLATVELTSEDEKHPIEDALAANIGSGWRAQQPGKQIIRFNFEKPRPITRIKLMFHEEEHPRTQEFVLRWSADGGKTYREIVRQQYNFSPPDTTCELEDYFPKIDGLTTLELTIVPNISGGDTRASLAQILLA